MKLFLVITAGLFTSILLIVLSLKILIRMIININPRPPTKEEWKAGRHNSYFK